MSAGGYLARTLVARAPVEFDAKRRTPGLEPGTLGQQRTARQERRDERDDKHTVPPALPRHKRQDDPEREGDFKFERWKIWKEKTGRAAGNECERWDGRNGRHVQRSCKKQDQCARRAFRVFCGVSRPIAARLVAEPATG